MKPFGQKVGFHVRNLAWRISTARGSEDLRKRPLSATLDYRLTDILMEGMPTFEPHLLDGLADRPRRTMGWI